MRNSKGIIYVMVSKKDGSTAPVMVAPYPVTNGWLQSDPTWQLHFDTVLGFNNQQVQITLPLEVIPARDNFGKTIARQGMSLPSVQSTYMREFLLAWTKKLQEMKDAVIHSSPFGWNVENGEVTGFCYGARVWMPGGDRPAATADPVLAQQYKPLGDGRPWHAAAKMITGQKRPALDAILAASFAAPLVRFTGEKGMLISAYSKETGIGKSTTVNVAQAVWGSPHLGVQSLTDTQNSVIGKIGQLRSLPMFWDELKTEEDTLKFVNLTFQVTGGKGKSRLSQDSAQKEVGAWQTLMLAASNDSLLDFIARKTKTTTAGVVRVFEFLVPPAQTKLETGVVTRMVAKLNDNYGQAGLVYAKFLGENHERIGKEVAEFHDKMARRLNIQTSERIWAAAISTMLMGARYANELGLTKIDDKALLQFLVDTLAELRKEVADAPSDMNNINAVINVLAQYLNAHRARNTLVTNRIHISAGPPRMKDYKVLVDSNKLDAVYVHRGVEDKMMRISTTHLRQWLADRGYSPHIIMRSFKDMLGARLNVRARLGSGTEFVGVTEYVTEFDFAGAQFAGLQEFATGAEMATA
jgi:hypothetical protein